MTKILGLDLGTNSIGWAIRDTDTIEENQIIDFGVGIFEAGMGTNKSGEFSRAAERRTNRSKRRLYNAKRYRKWATLNVLIENKMCPISIEELRLWSIGNWEIGKNKGRAYPTSPDFIAWLAMDFDRIGKDIDEDIQLIPAFSNPYGLRINLLEKFDENDNLRMYKIGRAFYHLVQRRGFKTSRKSGKSGFARNEELERLKEANPNIQISQILQSKLDNENKRIRASGVIQRSYFEEEFKAICKKQNISQEIENKIFKAIYFVRPLRTQKGLVGKCTLEKGKTRIPISHPAFEEFRALAFINNIQWRETDSNKPFESIPINLKKQILKDLFFRRLESGKNKGKIDVSGSIEFDDIIKKYSEKGKREFNYRNKPNISTCPFIAGLMNVFDKEWENKFINDDDKFGINWNGLKLEYIVKYGKSINKKRSLKYEDIWHLLFDYLQTKDKEEELVDFCKNVLGWDEIKTSEFAEINISQGFGSLSQSAINKIIPFLQEGFIYSEAVSYANLSKVLGKENFIKNKKTITQSIAKTIKETDILKEKLNIVNGLIQEYFAENPTTRAKGVDDMIKEMSYEDTLRKLKNFFGESNWNEKAESQQKEYIDFVFNKYISFLEGKQSNEEKASSNLNKKAVIDYYKLPRLDEAIKTTLKTKFNATEAGLKQMYHPSDIEMYPKAVFNEKSKVYELGDPNPPSKGWKNPMAMRAMYELRNLINYLLEIGKIDADTKIVVEMARELNTINERKALEDWQKDRENENKEFAISIAEMYGITNPTIEDYNKYRAAIEQISDYEFESGKEPIFKKKYEEFVKTYITGEIIKEIDEIDDSETEINEKSGESNEDISYDYLMYLILTRDRFSQLLSSKIPNSRKVIKQIIKPVKDFKNKREALKEMLTKYRLWKQQKFQCFYSGQFIPIAKLFSNEYQIEHTIPRSISFDNELKNLTVCDTEYNNIVKNNRFPTECKNYYKADICKTVKGDIMCPSIKERIELLIKPKVVELTKRIKNLKSTAKKIKDWEVDKKNANIRLRHYLKFELEYWEKKLLTFTIKKEDWKDKWKNSQLIDTQIITKYARAYLKSLFNKVDVQKGQITAEFRKIYGIMGDEKKDRSKHSHHAKDAAVLTLIPSSAKREDILKKYYLAKENYQSYHEIPYSSFIISHIQNIEEKVLINHIKKDQTLSETKKKVRKRGKVVYLKDKETGKYLKDEQGKKIPMIMQGDSIRGQLHKETYFGAIKVSERNEDGFVLKENGNYKLKQKNNEDEIWIVVRKPIESLNIEKDIIVDEILKNYIKIQLNNGNKLNELCDFNGKKIRHIRCRVKAGVGFLSKEKALPIKKHVFESKHEHKKEYLVQNEENYLYLLYEGVNDKNKTIRGYIILNLLDIAQMGISNIDQLKAEPEFQKLNKNKKELHLKAILKVGDRVIFYKENKDEISFHNCNERLYKIFKFNEMTTTGLLYCQFHLEARPDNELGDGETLFCPEKYQARLKLTSDNFNCLIENIDFKIKLDGEIIFL